MSDVTLWLQDHLGLLDMTETDLNSLIYHPRHGTLCRRSLSYLRESTLCANKFSDIRAAEKLTKNVKIYKETRSKIFDAACKVSRDKTDLENLRGELECSRQRLNNLKQVLNLTENSIEIFNKISNRSKEAMSRAAMITNNADYIATTDLADIYSEEDLRKTNSYIITELQLSIVEKEARSWVNQANTLNSAITVILSAIQDKMKNLEVPTYSMYRFSQLPKQDYRDLTALKLPQVEEISVDECPEMRERLEYYDGLVQKVVLLGQQVNKLVEEYETRRKAQRPAKERRLEKCLKSLKKLRDIENIINGSNDANTIAELASYSPTL